MQKAAEETGTNPRMKNLICEENLKGAAPPPAREGETFEEVKQRVVLSEFGADENCQMNSSWRLKILT